VGDSVYIPRGTIHRKILETRLPGQSNCSLRTRTSLRPSKRKARHDGYHQYASVGPDQRPRLIVTAGFRHLLEIACQLVPAGYGTVLGLRQIGCLTEAEMALIIHPKHPLAPSGPPADIGRLVPAALLIRTKFSGQQKVVGPLANLSKLFATTIGEDD